MTVNEQMAIRYGDPNGAGGKGFAVHGVGSRQRAVPVEDARQHTWRSAG